MIAETEATLQAALHQVHGALVAADVVGAANAMREAVRLCEEARRNAVPVSGESLRELQRLFESCLEANHRLGQQLGERLEAGSKGRRAARAYGSRRVPKARSNG